MTGSRGKKKSGTEARATIGIIGGSGLYTMPGLADTREIRVKTPFGEPSDGIVIGTLEGKRVAFLARHGRGHRILPSEINFRANICAMKQLGVERIISASAVGSLQEDLRPGEFLIADQFVDRTKNRVSTFFGGGLVAHVTFDKPTCGQVSAVLADASAKCGVKVHPRGTYVCIEGPQFSTLAEAHVHRQLRFEVIGMTNVTEAKLAREAEICYATIAQIMETLSRNAENAQRVLREAVRAMPAERNCKCGAALRHALITDMKLVPAVTKKRLAPIIGKYLS